MPEKQDNNDLHLPNLSIQGFRGIKDLSIPKLGRVTLLAGKNSVGKTTLLEAVAIFAARGRRPIVFNLLEGRNEWINMTDEDGDKYSTPDIAALFHGRGGSKNSSNENKLPEGNAPFLSAKLSVYNPIVLGPSKKEEQLTIKKASIRDLTEEQQLELIEDLPPEYDDDDLGLIKVVFRRKEYMFPWANFKNPRLRRLPRILRSFDSESELPAEIGCETVGPELLQNNKIARFWDEISLTDNEDRAVEALRLIFGDKVDRIAVIGDEERSYRQRGGRRVMVKLKDQIDRVPLKSLGDGAVRLFSVALALVNSRDGILLIDEAENGIHHSVQSDFWRMVLRMARENNTQVLATTHSWDCVRGFAQAAADDQDAEGVLYRLERDDEDVWAVFYPEDQLKIAAEQGTEVR